MPELGGMDAAERIRTVDPVSYTHLDLRSYARQVLDIIPTVHEGAAVRQMEKRGIQTNIGHLNREIRAANRLMKSTPVSYTHLLPGGCD